jgi:hypothetical protein
MKIKLFKKIFLSSVIFTPFLVLASGDSLNTVIINIARLIQNGLIPIVIGLALLAFLWGVMKYGTSQDEAARKESISIIINGLIVLFVMISVWGLVALFFNFFGLNPNGPVNLQNKPIPTESLIVR